MKVIGTAGHVDHGKSTLIAALTGTHPDRLKEEREREMTIDLGFGWLTAPNGEEIGIIDVPGHRDFIENMLAGIGGIDAVLLVVAADEGVMPQTYEHLAIIDLLRIPTGMVVVTKVDLVPDPDWLDLIESDIRAGLAGSVLARAPAVRVSARTGLGLDALRETLRGILQAVPPRPDLGRPRLPIDRVFSMSGFGTVVTGTLTDGHLDVGEEVIILPSGRAGRVRGLQTHRKKAERAMPGSRTAVNISGLSVDEIHRGDVLCLHGHYEPTRRLDVRLRLLADVSPLAHATQVKLFTGAAETVSTARLLEGDLLRAEDEAWAQLELREPVVVAPGDRFVLRRPSPAETLGGGTIVDALPKSRHRRRDATVLARLESLTLGTPPEQLLQAAMALGPASLREIVARSRLDPEIAVSALDDLLASGSLLLLEEGNPSPAADLLGIPAANWQLLATRLASELEAYHREYPLRRGMPREELKSRLRLQPHAFNAVIDFASRSPSPDLLVDSNRWIALPGHTVDFTAAQRAKADALLARFAAAPFAPPSVRECRAELGDEVYAALVDSEQLVPVSADIVFRRTDYDGIVERVQEYLSRSDRMTVAEARDLLATSRKYVLPLLEHLDATGVTLREGDYRRLRR